MILWMLSHRKPFHFLPTITVFLFCPEPGFLNCYPWKLFSGLKIKEELLAICV
ncbi:MAG: hypothetical protein FD166_946 [Bacteroidetes bacterium]|nr:MAG: hypothetical protein FD166_946 [Bacteroidota bacterium]